VTPPSSEPFPRPTNASATGNSPNLLSQRDRPRSERKRQLRRTFRHSPRDWSPSQIRIISLLQLVNRFDGIPHSSLDPDSRQIVNEGIFLAVRFSPIIAFSTASLNALALVGSFTALFAIEDEGKSTY